jgi:hypothetical protein
VVEELPPFLTKGITKKIKESKGGPRKLEML